MTTESRNSTFNLPLILSIVLVASLVICYFSIPSFENFLNESWIILTENDKEKTREYVDSLGWKGPLFLILLMIAQMFLLVVPSVLIMVVSILVYGPYWGSLIILIAVFSASTIGYAIGSYFGELFIERLLGKDNTKKVEDFMKEYGVGAVIVTRINPFLSNDAISFVGGILSMSYKKFIGATMIGIVPLVAYIAWFGESTESMETGLLWGSIVCLFIFLAYLYWDKKIRKK